MNSNCNRNGCCCKCKFTMHFSSEKRLNEKKIKPFTLLNINFECEQKKNHTMESRRFVSMWREVWKCFGGTQNKNQIEIGKCENSSNAMERENWHWNRSMAFRKCISIHSHSSKIEFPLLNRSGKTYSCIPNSIPFNWRLAIDRSRIAGEKIISKFSTLILSLFVDDSEKKN